MITTCCTEKTLSDHFAPAMEQLSSAPGKKGERFVNLVRKFICGSYDNYVVSCLVHLSLIVFCPRFCTVCQGYCDGSHSNYPKQRAAVATSIKDLVGDLFWPDMDLSSSLCKYPDRLASCSSVGIFWSGSGGKEIKLPSLGPFIGWNIANLRFVLIQYRFFSKICVIFSFPGLCGYSVWRDNLQNRQHFFSHIFFFF